MDPVTATPAQPVNYATLTAIYGSLLGALLLAAATGRAENPPTGAELAPLGAATFTLSKAIAHEKVETWVRAPFVEELPDGEKRPRGTGMRYAVGELLSCPRCLGVWSALALVALRTISPPAGRTVNAVLASSAANDFLHAGFRYVCNRADGPAN